MKPVKSVRITDKSIPLATRRRLERIMRRNLNKHWPNGPFSFQYGDVDYSEYPISPIHLPGR